PEESLLGLGGELQDRLTLADEAVLFAGELLDVGGIVAQGVDGLGEEAGPGAERGDVALGRLDFLAARAGAQRAAHAPAREQTDHERRSRDERQTAAAHRTTRWYRLRPG